MTGMDGGDTLCKKWMNIQYGCNFSHDVDHQSYMDGFKKFLGGPQMICLSPFEET
jgi:hypothetical protein